MKALLFHAVWDAFLHSVFVFTRSLGRKPLPGGASPQAAAVELKAARRHGCAIRKEEARELKFSAIAADITVGNRVVFGTGDIILLIIALMIVLCGLLGAWQNARDARRVKELILAAKSLDIGEGITLLDGIRAYYCDEGTWEGYLNKAQVIVYREDDGRARMRLDVNMDTKEMSICEYDRRPAPMRECEVEPKLKAMVQAVRDLQKNPEL